MSLSALSRSLSSGRDMDDLFDRLFHPISNGSATWSPPLSTWEDDGKYHIEMDLPGFSMDGIEVTYEDRKLSIKASRAKASRKYHLDERRWGEHSRVVLMPEHVDGDSISATYENGVLRVTAGKAPDKIPKKIEVNYS